MLILCYLFFETFHLILHNYIIINQIKQEQPKKTLKYGVINKHKSTPQ